MNCTRCECTGFLNLHQIPDDVMVAAENGPDFCAVILAWMAANDDHDVQICDCCGDGEEWYGEPGEHDESDYGVGGPYAYNGGLPECW